MKRIIVLAMLMMVSSISMAQKESRAALVFDLEGGCDVTYVYDGEQYVLNGDEKIRAQYAGGSIKNVVPDAPYSNAKISCHGTHSIPVENTDILDGGFCELNGFFSEDVRGAVTKGGTWVFQCNFPKFNYKKFLAEQP